MPAPSPRRFRAVIGVVAVLVLVAVGVLGYVVIERVRGGPGIGAAPTGSTIDLGSVEAAATTSSGVGGGWAPEVRGRTPLRGFGEVAGVVTAPDGGTCEVCLLTALDAAQRDRGLMQVTDPTLGGYDGMLFVFEEPTSIFFWMSDTPLPLSIAYLDADGRAGDVIDMAPCEKGGDCPGYPPTGPYRFAVEVPQGNAEALGLIKGSVLRLTATPCPLAAKSG